jgi:hypothetical protein
MNQYYALLEQLLVKSPLTVKVSVAESNLRLGLKSALQSYNEGQAIMEMEEETRVIRICTKDDKYEISLVPRDTPRHNTFTFEIIEEDNNGST